MSLALNLIDDCLSSLPKASVSTSTKPLKMRVIETKKHKFSDGIPQKGRNFQVVEIPEVLSTPLKDGQVLIKAEYISVDPYLRYRLGRFAQSPSQTAVSGQVAKVVKSNNSSYKIGDILFGYFPWQTYSIINPSKSHALSSSGVQIVPSQNKISHSYYLGSYGMPGMTAYYGMIELADLQQNKVVLVSGGAGAVGSIVGQIAKIYNCYVIASAGTQEKLNWMKNELGFDFVFNYKNYNSFDKMKNILKEALNKGKKKSIDYYFDNTGGYITDCTWDLLGQGAKVLICGQIAVYNRKESEGKYMVEHFLSKLIYREIMVKGIYVSNMSQKYKNEFYEKMKEWILNGRVKVKETVLNGFDKVPDAFIGLFTGSNIGKMVVKC